MSILTLGSKKKGEGKFPIKEEAKKERRKISNQRKKGSKEIPNQRVGENEKKGKKIPSQRKRKEWEKVKKKKAPGQRNQKKCAERSWDQTISEQYRIVTK